jgi:hypothetical protein
VRTDQEIAVKVDIFNDRCERLAEIVDGEEIKQISCMSLDVRRRVASRREWRST